MQFFDELYQKTLSENDRNLKFWSNYLNDLKSLNFNLYSEKLKVPTLVPIGNKIFFRGELKHTNEVTVSLGADYFVKCSIAQAEILRQHRIKDAQSKVDIFIKEKEHLENQISFTKENINIEDGQEILEVYTEEEDKIWREKHRENVKKYKQEKGIETVSKEEFTNEELWERLEELELQEELENEMLDNYNEIVDKRKENMFLINEEKMLLNSYKEDLEVKNQNNLVSNEDTNKPIQKIVKTNDDKVENATNPVHAQLSNQDLLQKVLDKQNELENKLHELKYREREQSKTEQDLLSRLDEIEQLDELEDEIERLDNILNTEDMESEEDSTSSSTRLKKSIIFADDVDKNTLEINFTHSKEEPSSKQYNPDAGITKPSDLYEAYSDLLDKKTTSILKKSKYGLDPLVENSPNVSQSPKINFIDNRIIPECIERDEYRTIVIKDVVESVGVNQHKIEGGARPTSLFKKKRMQNKT